MKILNKNKSISVFILLLFVLQLGWSQTYSADEDNDTEASTELNGQEVSQSFFDSYFDTTPNETLNTITGNSVAITQVSSFNTAVVKVASRASDINISQNGDANNVNLTYQVDAVVADLEQNGDNNTILDYVIDPSAKVSLELKQNGDDLNFERFGANNISKNIKFTQTSASPTVIIRSFN
ncbi:hypothetical protein CLV86_2681 [Lacinutrix venerupis]|uniref:Secreted protein n=1 Tax=Lacinutrix venerupis TaxID=1486034 RepID=A0AAC9LLA5_9FLAO|nr:hypothetical protein [Lacinutrix venerupis]APX99642.1 hypothetical protein BWR22_04720 [Lacinutrix venerupis]RLJ61170.1 hypothetical protein CLV86_2681 [Lacinutrix venerupis]